MATGELAQQTRSSAAASAQDEVGAPPAEFGVGILSTGRRSVAKMYEPEKSVVPFSVPQLARLDEALTLASRETGIDFSIYLGELGTGGTATRAAAEKLHASIGERAPDSVLIAVSPGERVVEIVTGADAFHRLPDRSAKLAVMSMVASFREGDLVGGLVSGLRMLADQAGHAPA